MKIIGITGSIATGKSFVANCFVKLGAKLFDADKTVHDIISNDPKAANKIRDIFPTSYIDGKINRQILSALIFQDNSKRQELENIIYPILDIKRNEFLTKCRKDNVKIVVMEIPLLFEKNKQHLCDYILVTKIDKETQQKRALARENMTIEKFKSINKLQIPTEEKVQMADFVIDTSLDEYSLYKKLESIISII